PPHALTNSGKAATHNIKDKVLKFLEGIDIRVSHPIEGTGKRVTHRAFPTYGSKHVESVTQ
ncbi:MAG: hypothetical protein RLZZ157_1942, partial [Pseudomonadota bacterium]